MKQTLAWIRVHFWTKGVKDTVIGGIILAVLGSLWLWSKSNFSSNAFAAAVAAKLTVTTGWRWLASPSDVSRGVVLLLTIFAASLAVYIARPLIRLAISDLKPRRGVIVDPKDLRELVEAAKLGRHPQGPAMSDSKPSESMAKFMRLLAQNHPSPIRMGTVSRALSVSIVAAETYIDDAERNGFVSALRGGPQGLMAMLTAKGREYCVKHGLDT
jgi:hypothetical protein